MASDPEILYLIDAHSLIFQVFHAIPGMTSPAGLPTNAVFGFTRDLIYLRTDKKPDYLVCCFDRPGPVFREEIYPEYKANRGPMPDDLQTQIPEIHRLLHGMSVPEVGREGFEADDIIATLARAGAARGLQVTICTSDKDCRQLIDDNTRLLNIRKKQEMGRDELMKDWGIKPEQVVELQALVGDSVDNVPGVPGVGLKTAAALLQEFGTIENILNSIDKVTGAKRRENLQNSAGIIQTSKQLVKLRDDVPVTLDWDAWRLQDADVQELTDLFREWGFRGFATEVRKWPTRQKPMKPVQRGLFDLDEEPTSESPETARDSWQGMYHLVDNPTKFTDFATQLRQQNRFAFDLETTGLEPCQAELVGFAFSWKEGEAYYLPVRGPVADEKLDVDDVLTELRPIFADGAIAKVNQNIKYDWLVLRRYGVEVNGISGDPMVADYLLHAGERSHGMEDLSLRYLNHQVIPITDLIGKRGKKQLQMDQVATAKVADYAGEDADVAWRLTELIEPQLQDLRRLYDEVEIPLIEVLAELEFNGIRLDVSLLKQFSRDMSQQLKGIESQIHELAGREFNIASPRQLREVLFDELKLPKQRRTGITGEASTAQLSLERLAAQGHELPGRILEHRHLAKLMGTYVDALPDLVNPETGRVHASFNQTVAATGRLSSSDPDLQNIPVRTEQGRQIRQAFIPEDGWQLLTADYSQIELRMLAHFCGDEHLRQAFVDDRDIHASVAAQIFGTSEAEVSSENRRAAKTVNFGVIYGISAFGLAERLGMSKEEAARFIEAYFNRYPKVLEYQDQLLVEGRKNGYVSTILGRRRAITGIRARTTYAQRNQPEREAINMEIQGSAADLMKLAMLHVFRRLRKERKQARMLLTVHDELVFEVPPDEIEDVAGLVNEEMTSVLEKRLKLEVPLKVDLGLGSNWLDIDDYQTEPATTQAGSLGAAAG